jgi:hypothetical protein
MDNREQREQARSTKLWPLSFDTSNPAPKIRCLSPCSSRQNAAFSRKKGQLANAVDAYKSFDHGESGWVK